ncbi:uncharacterized protein [Prorops nasuta]|uniref:uncharacterized protein isoform X2 n=1 Tax=Prorops nasuta TaxID=863751 RepID=UPI0034CEB282
MTLTLRDRICPILTLLLILHVSPLFGKLQQIKPGCRYEGRRYQEGASVPTSEACLQCKCTEGSLRCRLRICPRLPNPPPPGCRIKLPEENVCCAELVCGELLDAENMLRRSNAENLKSANDEDLHSRLEGCLHDGIRYGPGSAMMGSRRCEYCYCISGTRRCIRPKCLLPLPGCTALYAPHSCCPVAYNCTREVLPSTTPPLTANGCQIKDRIYKEGEMVREISWKAACDNCFCAMGAIRCVPLACALPLQGCSPIVREGQCCPSTYNCSGSIEVKATQNYASYAFISKDYAKFRKETNFFPVIEQTTDLSVEGRGHRVVEENLEGRTTDADQETSTVIDVVESTAVPSATGMDVEITDNEIPSEIEDRAKSTTAIILPTTTTYESTDQTSIDTTIAELFTETTHDIPETSATVIKFVTTVDSALSNLNEKKDVKAKIEKFNVTENRESTLIPDDEGDQERTDYDTKQNVTDFAGNLTVTEAMGKGPVNGPSSAVLMPGNILVMNVTVKTNVSVGHIQGVTINPIRSIPPDVEAILNITHREKTDEYDYDYSEPTLPPSLPNVRIIPFVAADALDKDKDLPSSVTGYTSNSIIAHSELRPTEKTAFYDIIAQKNRFSPPVETEGGFVPREPPYFNPSFHSTDLSLEIGTGVTVIPAPIANPHRKNDDLGSNCLYESREYRHGEMLPGMGICIICMCYNGEVVCSSEKCPLKKISCRRINTEQECCGRIVCDNEESPTVVLDRADATAPSQHQPIVSPDPFRDVIKTEPAPDLPSLIEDMIPYLVEHGITTLRPTTPMTAALLKLPMQSQGHKTHDPNFNLVDKLAPPIRPSFDNREGQADKYPSNVLQTYEDSSLTHNELDQILRQKAQEVKLSWEKTTLIRIDHTTPVPVQEISSETVSATATSLVGLNKNNSDSSATNKHRDQFPTRKHDSSTVAVSSSAETDEDDHSIFSLDSVLDFFFKETNQSTTGLDAIGEPVIYLPNSTRATLPKISEVSVTSAPPASIAPTSKANLTSVTVTSSTDRRVDATEAPVGGLLKLAGCNIYGRMYRVGRIITELSDRCRECRCTEVGVQCKQLQC